MKKGTIAVIGCGEAGFEMHLPALARMKDITVVGACDTDEARRQRASAKFSFPVFADYRDMLAKANPETVIVATPPDLHTSICMDAIASGANIICEKPFVPNVPEGLQIIGAAEKAGVRIALNHEFREMPVFRAVIDATRNSGEKIFFASLWQNTDVPPWTEKGWRGAMLRRTLHEAGIHLIDYILALFGETPMYAWASMSAGGLNDSGSDALVVVSLEFSGGRIAQLVQNRLCKGETHYFEVRADTPGASYRASFGGRARLTTGLYRSTVPHVRFDYGVSGLAWTENGNKRKFLARNPPDPRVVSTQLVLERSLEAFRTGGRPPATAEDALEALRVIDACYASAKNGTRMQIGA
jgi:predicted dehydrogenase